MQALTADQTTLQSARSATISESSPRSAVYLTALSSAVVVLALVVQVSRLGSAFFVFAFAIPPVVFFLGVVDQVGLTAMGLWKLRWQQFLAAAATIAVNAVVGGAFVALTVRGLFRTTPTWLTTVIGAAITLLIAFAFLRNQWRAWTRVAAALPMRMRAGSCAGPHP